MNQPHTFGWVATPFERRCINRVVSVSSKSVGTGVLLSLLLAKRLHNAFARLCPVSMKTGSVARCLPVSVGESHRIAERVDLPLALAQLRPIWGLVTLAPRAGFGAEVEGVCVRVNENTARLPVNDAGNHFFQLLIFPREWQIGCDLRGRVAQPHRVYVSGDHVGVRPALMHAESDRRIECVRETVLKEPGDFRVSNRKFCFGNLRFNGLAHELPLANYGTLPYKLMTC